MNTGAVTQCNTFNDVDVKSKIISLQSSWVKKLYDGNNRD